MKKSVLGFVFAFTMLLVSCISTVSRDQRFALASVLEIQADQSGEEDVLARLGQPNVQEIVDGGKEWTYHFPQTQAQQATISFYPNSRKVKAVIWIPKDSADGALIKVQKRILQKFSTVNFQLKEAEQNSSRPVHYISSEVVYVDSGRGINILSRNGSDQVHAVAWKSTKLRTPSTE